ncbi:TetR/AcrR family transcriptional regulator [Paenibacillus sp. MMS20-IR301]|uniref:TetR/AcrR family transcriptional regulator n=1 Tax=Paenibacillus sp. MMS20-IR301 TaxID=2895946 RepID=UPI0028EA48DC|nr:TetR/AcrR family transcriptional regulator [Paenibacillus sp. MMS20-IR301]WNS45908.1 TetR/AcrR family transcriptional regulator [Paenibacillus sp. MMS20-IR301]
MMRYKKSEEKRKQILQAAFRALAERGYDAVTLQTIADQAEVSKGVVHYYFENKEAVLVELLEWLTGKISAKEQEAVAGQHTATGKLMAYIDSAFPGPAQNRSFYRVYLDFLARASRTPAYREINQRFYDSCAGISTEILLLGQEEGIFSRTLSPEVTVPVIRAVIDGCLIQWLMADNDELHHVFKESCYTAIMKMLSV